MWLNMVVISSSTATVLKVIRTPVALMLSSVILWAFFPVFLANMNDLTPNLALLAAGGLNLAGGLVALLLVLLTGPSSLHALMRAARSGRVLTLLIVDGLAILISNLLLILALLGAADAAATVLVEFWPILVALSLPLLIPAFRPITIRTLAAAALAALSVTIALIPAWLEAAPLFGVVTLALGAAMFQAVTVTANQKLLLLVEPSSRKLGKNLSLQASRQLIAAIPVALLLPFLLGEQVPASLPSLSILAGLFALISALLYSRALQLSLNSSLALLWVLVPVVSLLGLVLTGVESPSVFLIISGGFALAANVVSLRRDRKT